MARTSLAYFLKPEDEVIMKTLDGSDLVGKPQPKISEEELTSVEWTKRKVMALKTLGAKAVASSG